MPLLSEAVADLEGIKSPRSDVDLETDDSLNF